MIEKNINQISFYFVEEGPSHGSEDMKGGKITINLKELHSNRKRRNTCTLVKSWKCTKDAGVVTVMHRKSGVLGLT